MHIASKNNLRENIQNEMFRNLMSYFSFSVCIGMYENDAYNIFNSTITKHLTWHDLCCVSTFTPRQEINKLYPTFLLEI